MKTIYVTKPSQEKAKRVCKNCGVDISHKRKGAEFCCKTCYRAYNSITNEFSRYN